jgi:Tol biopolymer transport system component
MIMTTARRIYFLVRLRAALLLAAGMALAACIPSGVAGVSSDSKRLAIVNNNDLFVYSKDGSGPDYYAFFTDTRYSPALAPDGKAIVYVDRAGRLTYQPLDGRTPRLLLPNSISNPGPGLLTFLPDGTLLLYNTTAALDRDLRIFELVNGQTTVHLTGISQIFVGANVIKPKKTGSQVSPYAAGRIDASRADQVNLVVLPTACLLDSKTCFFSYTLDARGFHENGPLARTYDTDTQIFFSRRVSDDLTAGVLTPDGKHLVVRLRSLISPEKSQSLYLLDLTNNAPPVALVENAAGRPDYAISPDGKQIAYEESINGVAFVRLYNLATGDRTDLGPGSLDPQWWQ